MTAQTIKPAITYTVYYRTGGTENFRWQTTFERHTTREEAQASCDEIRRQGYPAHYERTDRLERIGLPETYE